jgi:sigma-54 dependent transcriptional regulator, flagellar regulatory protein
MQALKKSILIAASCSSTVLITGESGTGKELIARSIHELSARRSHPFVAINCAALTESLLESELFGHVKGAFTGATSCKKRMFESVTEGRFRQDLYYRVNVFPIRSPALRDRIGDLPLLINMLLSRLSDGSRRAYGLRFDSEALKLLRNHGWSGNVRELENIIERLALTLGERELYPVLTCSLILNSMALLARTVKNRNRQQRTNLKRS